MSFWMKEGYLWAAIGCSELSISKEFVRTGLRFRYNTDFFPAEKTEVGNMQLPASLRGKASRAANVLDVHGAHVVLAECR